MRWKRIILLVICVLLIFPQVSFAAHWQWVNSNDEIGFFFDTDSIHYGSHSNITGYSTLNKNLIVFWEKTVYSPEGAAGLAQRFNDDRYANVEYCIKKTGVLRKEKQMATYSATYYANDVPLETFDDFNSYEILPDTMGEDIYNAVIDYCINHNAMVELNSY